MREQKKRQKENTWKRNHQTLTVSKIKDKKLKTQKKPHCLKGVFQTTYAPLSSSANSPKDK